MLQRDTRLTKVPAVWKEIWRAFKTYEARKGQIADSFHRRSMMLRWALGFFVIALIAAVLGFGGIAVAAAGIAKIIFYIFLVLFLVSLIGHLASRT
jgi:uncharacterized membrane protein YtjA (UPF0391 family)